MSQSLTDIVREAVRASGFEAELTPEARAQLQRIMADAKELPAADARDMRDQLWSSIDNKETRDLDQVEVAESLNGGEILLRIGIADVDAFVPKDSPLDKHAHQNTTSVYAGRAVVPMLPAELSEGVTSLMEGEDRLAIVAETIVCSDGACRVGEVYRAIVCNKAQLDYGTVGAWLSGGSLPPSIAKVKGLEQQLKLQDEAAQRLRAGRDKHGALELETIEARPVLQNDDVVNLELVRKTRASDLIEDFMIATNVAVAGFLEKHNVAWIRRVLHAPERWPRIVELARQHGVDLPAQPDRMALARFLADQRKTQPASFADLSLAVVKLLGSGEYVVEHKGEEMEGHFGLAVDDYTHSTAPNRRFSDLVTQRLVKALLEGKGTPYSDAELEEIAQHCTKMAEESRKMERSIRKFSAARLLQNRVGEEFDAIVSGVSDNGVFVRLLNPPAEGKLTHGDTHIDVGDKIRVRLASVDTQKGLIDLARA